MRKLTVLLTMLVLSTSTLLAAGPAADVRQAETTFAKAFADRDQTKFFAMILDDATFMNPRRTLNGKKEIIESWTRFFASKEAPFSWHPERVAVNGAGTIGVTSGPVLDDKGEQVGVFSSVWVKQDDGSWKVQFDGPGCPAPCAAATSKTDTKKE